MSDQISQDDIEHAINSATPYVLKGIRETTGLSLTELEKDPVMFGVVIGYLLDRVEHGKRASLDMWMNMPLSEIEEFMSRFEQVDEDAPSQDERPIESYPKE